VPAPSPRKDDIVSIVSDGGSSQNLMLFMRGKAMSGAPIIRGTSQFPKPPIMVGMTMKKIITNAWDVTTVL
jgi:thiamine monophosphate kinase